MSFEMKDHKISITLLNGKPAEVWYRNETHKSGNSDDYHYWLLLNTEGEEKWIPFTSRDFRSCWGVQVQEDHSVKSKWGDTYLRTNVRLIITLNNQVVYDECYGHNYLDALTQAPHLIREMSEHPFNFREPEKEIGRKIWYHNQPAIIDQVTLDQTAIWIKWDGEEGNFFNLDRPWDIGDESSFDYNEEWRRLGGVKTSILDHNIWWFRDREWQRPSEPEPTEDAVKEVKNDWGIPKFNPDIANAVCTAMKESILGDERNLDSSDENGVPDPPEMGTTRQEGLFSRQISPENLNAEYRKIGE